MIFIVVGYGLGILDGCIVDGVDVLVVVGSLDFFGGEVNLVLVGCCGGIVVVVVCVLYNGCMVGGCGV